MLSWQESKYILEGRELNSKFIAQIVTWRLIYSLKVLNKISDTIGLKKIKS